ncbi:MAG TPA: peptidoglycan DD-metalloendopeptidase family protein [Bacteroidota bacterium]|nr:peptidoglycan DD-metalloendopeptidase family protein [Bacteroidota bacterium]
MLRHSKFYIFSHGSLDLREVRLFKTKLLVSGAAIGLTILGILLALNHLGGDLLGLSIDRMSMLSAENQLLKEQIRQLGDKMSVVQHALERLSDRSNELRQAVDLTKIDDDTRSASIGGAVPPALNAFLSGEARDILNGSATLIDKLEREVRLQEASYAEITHRMEYNKGLFAHIPAIKPMSGAYSINSFGMRIHPVLHVYRMHDGIDIIGDVGTNVYAAGDGTVHFAGRTAGGYGVVVELSHGYGYSTLYAHLSRPLVREGQSVKRGELIAKSGRSGLVSGPHLHYEVRYLGRKQNPVDYFFDDVDAARYRSQLATVKSVRGEN